LGKQFITNKVFNMALNVETIVFVNKKWHRAGYVTCV
jgi:hypothetical protein